MSATEKALIEAVVALLDDIAGCIDVVDGHDGPSPNWAMRLDEEHGDRIRAAIGNASLTKVDGQS